MSKYCGMWVGEEGMKMGVAREVDRVLRQHACMHTHTTETFFCLVGLGDRKGMSYCRRHEGHSLFLQLREREREPFEKELYENLQ